MPLICDMTARLDAVDPMVQILRQAAEPFLDAGTLYGFEVAVSEALTNIVRHSYAEKVEGTGANVQVELQCDAMGVTLDLHDHGKPGPATLFTAARSLDEIDILADSGRGLALIRHYAADVVYTPGSHGNHLNLRFTPKEGTLPTHS